MKKKLMLIAALVLALVLCLCGCGKKKAEPTVRTETVIDSDGNEKTLTIISTGGEVGELPEFDAEEPTVANGLNQPKTPAGASASVTAPTATPDPSAKPTASPTASAKPVETPTPAPGSDEALAAEFERYNALSNDAQIEYFETFESPEAFIEWYNSVKKAYDIVHPPIVIKSGDVIDVG